MKITLDFDPTRDVDGDIVLPAVVSRIDKNGHSRQDLILDPVTIMSFRSERDAICYFVEHHEDIEEVTLSIY